METFIFIFGIDEFICQDTGFHTAANRANNYIESECPMDDPYGWVPSSEGKNIFRMSVG
jgi:hypothetical protein